MESNSQSSWANSPDPQASREKRGEDEIDNLDGQVTFILAIPNDSWKLAFPIVSFTRCIKGSMDLYTANKR